MSEDWKNSETEALFKAVLKLKTKGECEKFFRDLCTLSELKAMGERLVVAKMANDKIPYRKIASKTGASTATVTRVAHWLHHGEGGYKLVLKRL